jgi:hypothetical protein
MVFQLVCQLNNFSCIDTGDKTTPKGSPSSLCLESGVANWISYHLARWINNYSSLTSCCQIFVPSTPDQTQKICEDTFLKYLYHHSQSLQRLGSTMHLSVCCLGAHHRYPPFENSTI